MAGPELPDGPRPAALPAGAHRGRAGVRRGGPARLQPALPPATRGADRRHRGEPGGRPIPAIVGAAVATLRELGAEPFVVPAMGSHGGPTAEGQREVLEGYGVTVQRSGPHPGHDGRGGGGAHGGRGAGLHRPPRLGGGQGAGLRAGQGPHRLQSPHRERAVQDAGGGAGQATGGRDAARGRPCAGTSRTWRASCWARARWWGAWPWWRTRPTTPSASRPSRPEAFHATDESLLRQSNSFLPGSPSTTWTSWWWTGSGRTSPAAGWTPT